MKSTLTFLSARSGKSAMLIAMLGIAVGFSSCKNDDVEPEVISAISVVNASPTSGSLDFYINEQKVGAKSLPFGSKYDYVRAYSGSRTGKVIDSATKTTLYTKDFNLVIGKYHSLYIVKQNTEMSYALYEDDFKETGGKAQLRFINLSSDAPALSLELEGDTTTFSNRVFKATTPFKNVEPKKYKLNLKNTATGTIVASVADVDLTKDNFYTVWAKGLVTTSVDKEKLTLKVSKH